MQIASPRINLLIVWVIFSIGPTTAQGDQPPVSCPHGSCENPVVEHIEKGLRDHGITTDAAGLIDALKSSDRPWVRSRCAMLLGRMRAHDATPVLHSAATADPDDTVRLVATNALCELISESDCLNYLHLGFHKAEGDARRLHWAAALARAGDPTGVPVFRQALEDLSSREQAMKLLSAFLNLQTADFDSRALLTQWLQSEDAKVREIAANEAAAALLAGYLLIEEVEAQLLLLTTDEDPDVRKRAEAALVHGRSRSKRAERAQ